AEVGGVVGAAQVDGDAGVERLQVDQAGARADGGVERHVVGHQLVRAAAGDDGVVDRQHAAVDHRDLDRAAVGRDADDPVDRADDQVLVVGEGERLVDAGDV